MTPLEDAESTLCDDLELLAQVVESKDYREQFKEMLARLRDAHAFSSRGATGIPHTMTALLGAMEMYCVIVRDEARRIVEEQEQRGMTGREWDLGDLAAAAFDDTDEERHFDNIERARDVNR